MMCRAHGPVSGEVCSVPGCFETLRPHAADPVEASATCGAADCGMPLPCPLHPGGAADAGDREVAAHLAAAATAPRNSDQPLAVGARLNLPWAVVTVPAAGLTVGRDFAAQCGAQIEDFDNVSRTHARLTVRDGHLLVEDLDSTNGTTVNGVRITCGELRPLHAGDVLGFGNRLRATVMTEDERP